MLKVEYLGVPFNEQIAIVQALFCCPKKSCTLKMPPWIHLKPVTQIVVNADFEGTEKENVLRDFVELNI